MKKLIFVVMFMFVMLFTSLVIADVTGADDSFDFYVESFVDYTVYVSVYDRDFNEIEFFETNFDWDIKYVTCPLVHDAYLYCIEVFITNEEDYGIHHFTYVRYGSMGVYSDMDCGIYGYIAFELFVE